MLMSKSNAKEARSSTIDDRDKFHSFFSEFCCVFSLHYFFIHFFQPTLSLWVHILIELFFLKNAQFGAEQIVPNELDLNILKQHSG